MIVQIFNQYKLNIGVNEANDSIDTLPKQTKYSNERNGENVNTLSK